MSREMWKNSESVGSKMLNQVGQWTAGFVRRETGMMTTRIFLASTRPKEKLRLETELFFHYLDR
jgi:hypothetical protein